MLAALVLGWAPSPGADPGPCCSNCTAPQEKYFSVDTHGGFCGETCMKPSSYPIFHIFEPNLTKAAHNGLVCREQFTPFGTHYSVYNKTETHGAGPISVTLDLCGPGPTA